MSHIHIIGGGTFSHVRNHLALAAPAFGDTARQLYRLFRHEVEVEHQLQNPAADSASLTEYALEHVHLHLTKMADYNSNLVTNKDVADLIDQLKADPETRVIILNAALCDFYGEIGSLIDSGPHAERLKTSDGEVQMTLIPSEKLIGSIRTERKDIFVVGFKTTTNETSDEQYRIALNALKRDSINLVVANDTVTRNNMIVAPEETRYFETTDRSEVLAGLVKIVLSRSKNTFTRSTVIPDYHSVSWNSSMIPDNLRTVVDYCIAHGAYKPFRDVTAGHFAVKINDHCILTSKRKHNFNNLATDCLVRVEYEGDDKVVAYGAKPSVGGQSQRIIFKEHPDFDCIVHFHAPLREVHRDDIPVASQWQNECGSHQCGKNTSDNLIAFDTDLKAVMLDDHGPNIVFSKLTPAIKIIEFIEANWDLSQKTGGLVA